MVVIVLENVPRSVRGELTRWMLEVHPGVFVGSLSAMVRDRLWTKARQAAKGGGCILLYNADSEQGFAVRTAGPTRRRMEDFDGLALVRVP